ncbi:glycerol acyltransferase [Labilibaculum sp. A4]|uniref:1-acyl-sn-glycerol-3-phosphate acyltransferase n=1 Tax=Labilibaculum euxinus TaxID=2686357 RepID=UPI000F62497A|nr:1-acyl-sn-glycerol-3-phosphate acyltransferase [Labilibaculum euxinus]MDQ1772163.1 1-acyl-sn-glycerol-3-phosphate acyltransferase [Labilibaculum euxinus]MWN77866.1 glycerol acyltransferase [Labilibaculum euxinus]
MQKENTPESYLKIDIEKVFASKSERISKLLPKFIIRYLKRIVHQDELNDFLSRNYQKEGIEFADSVLEELQITFEIKGLENINKEGRYIFASNHPLGGPDGIILISIFGKHFPKIKFLVNDILMNIKNLSDVFVPINKHGGQAKEAARTIVEAYQSEATILTFPAGLVSRKQKGKIEDLEWKKSFISKAKKYKRDIVPIHINGRNSNFFYNLANLRKFLRLKSNLEMLYLPNELFKQRGKKFTICVGKPVSYQTFDKSMSYDKWAEKMKEKTYNLANQ